MLFFTLQMFQCVDLSQELFLPCCLSKGEWGQRRWWDIKMWRLWRRALQVGGSRRLNAGEQWKQKLWESMGNYGNNYGKHWKTMENRGKPWLIMEKYGKHLENPWRTTEHNGKDLVCGGALGRRTWSSHVRCGDHERWPRDVRRSQDESGVSLTGPWISTFILIFKNKCDYEWENQCFGVPIFKKNLHWFSTRSISVYRYIHIYI